jgi:hypothetical protein
MFSQYQRLNLPISASNREVIAKASRQMLKPESRFKREQRSARHQWFRNLLEHHANARKLAREFRL